MSKISESKINNLSKKLKNISDFDFNNDFLINVLKQDHKDINFKISSLIGKINRALKLDGKNFSFSLEKLESVEK